MDAPDSLTMTVVTVILFSRNVELAFITVVIIVPPLLAISLWFRAASDRGYLRVRDGIAKRGGKMIEFRADRSDFRRAGRPHARIIAARFDVGHGVRQRLDRRQRPADHEHRQDKQHRRNGRAELDLGDDAVPDFGDLIAWMRGNRKRAVGFSIDRDRNAQARRLRPHHGDEPFGRCIELVIGAPIRHVIAGRTEVQGCGSTGGFQRSSPTGAWAKGTPFQL